PARVMVSKEGYKPADRGLTKPWIPARIGYLPSGEPIETEGGHDRNALGSAAGSEVTIDLQREFTRFKATPGRNGTVTILGDGRVLYRSKGARAEPIDIAIKGIQTLTLVNSPKESQKDSGVRILNGVSLTY
ncbi:MAG TPA: NPCBM/NEW2 domain-containing protein, partial [Rhizorhapis sp.]|nr:NPCBM/NEW2 domain-containing protein [Rhizorhapis sp.]